MGTQDLKPCLTYGWLKGKKGPDMMSGPFLGNAVRPEVTSG